jgi:ribosomal protein S13
MREMFNNLAGFGKPTRHNFIKRFEYRFFLKHHFYKNFSFINMNAEHKKLINMYVSQLIYTSNDIYNLTRLNLIRLYLVKSFRGRAQMLGKPSRGQRT